MTAADLPAALASVPAAWRALLPGWTTVALQDVARRVEAVSDGRPIAPERPFRAFELTPPDAVNVVVFGQDPYPTAGHADGLAFSAGHGRPRSLARIFEVLAADRPGWKPPATWKLDGWARQGVLLLNPVLSVEVGRAGSHLGCGWQQLTAEVTAMLCARPEPPVFLLWGSQAQRFFEAAKPAGATPQVLVTRHPSYDIKRQFMADGSHFVRTAGRIDWWAL